MAVVRIKADLRRNYCKKEEDHSLDKEARIKVKARDGNPTTGSREESSSK